MPIDISQAQAIYDGQLPEEPKDEEWCSCGRSIGVPEEDDDEYVCEACEEQEWERGFRIRNSK